MLIENDVFYHKLEDKLVAMYTITSTEVISEDTMVNYRYILLKDTSDIAGIDIDVSQYNSDQVQITVTVLYSGDEILKVLKSFLHDLKKDLSYREKTAKAFRSLAG